MNCQIFKKFTLVNKDPLVVVKMIQGYVTYNIYYRYNDNAIRNLKVVVQLLMIKFLIQVCLPLLRRKDLKRNQSLKMNLEWSSSRIIHYTLSETMKSRMQIKTKKCCSLMLHCLKTNSTSIRTNQTKHLPISTWLQIIFLNFPLLQFNKHLVYYLLLEKIIGKVSYWKRFDTAILGGGGYG